MGTCLFGTQGDHRIDACRAVRRHHASRKTNDRQNGSSSGQGYWIGGRKLKENPVLPEPPPDRNRHPEPEAGGDELATLLDDQALHAPRLPAPRHPAAELLRALSATA